jgi:hypothetical protein
VHADEREPSTTPLPQPAPAPRGPGALVVAITLAIVILVAVGGSISCLVNYDLIGNGHMPRAAVFSLVPLLIVNALFVLRGRRQPFATHKLAFVYVVVLVMSGLPGVTMVSMLYQGLVDASYHAGGDNDYAREVLPYVKPWMVPEGDSDAPAIAWAYHGMPFGERPPYGAWVRPLLAWTPFLLAILLMQVCATALFRQRWDEERLTYPLAQAPVELIAYDGPRDAVPRVMRSWLFWLTFLIPCIIHSKNALHLYYPYAVGKTNLNANIGVIFGGPPLSYFDNLPVELYLETVGATYLIPTATALSLWVFWLWRRVIMVLRYQRGLTDHNVYLEEQGVGGQLVLATVCVVAAARALRRRARARPSASGLGGPGGEEVGLRWAAMGFLAGVVVVLATAVAASGWRSVPPMLLVIVLFLAGSTIVSRLVAESGLFCVWSPLCPPQGRVAQLLGAWPGFDPTTPAWRQTMTGLNYMSWTIQHTAGSPMANVLQARKVGALTGLSQRALLLGIVAGIVVGYLACHPASLWALYNNGIYGMGWFSRQMSGALPGAIHYHTTALKPFEAADFAGMGHGALIVMALAAVRTRWHHFPLQPFAYAASMGPPWMMDRYGFSIFLGWAASHLVLRYGGIRTHRKLRPAAFGLIAGNAVILLLWTMVAYVRPMEGVLIIE